MRPTLTTGTVDCYSNRCLSVVFPACFAKTQSSMCKSLISGLLKYTWFESEIQRDAFSKMSMPFMRNVNILPHSTARCHRSINRDSVLCEHYRMQWRILWIERTHLIIKWPFRNLKKPLSTWVVGWINDHIHCSSEANRGTLDFQFSAVEIMIELCGVLRDFHIWMALKGYWNKAFNCFCIANIRAQRIHRSLFKCFFNHIHIMLFHPFKRHIMVFSYT